MKACRLPDKTVVIIKRFDITSPSMLQPALRELRLLHKFRSVAAVLDVRGFFLESAKTLGVQKRYMFLEFPFLQAGDGEPATLAHRHRALRQAVATGAMSEEERMVDLCQIYHEVAEGLSIVHAAGVTHRDVKPTNILLKEVDGRWRPVLADFEVGRDAERQRNGQTVTFNSSARAFLGTEGYRPPPSDQNLHEYTVGAADVWGLGVLVAYEIFPSHMFRGAPRCPSALQEQCLWEAHDEYTRRLEEDLPDCAGFFKATVLGGDSVEGTGRFASICARMLFERPRMASIVELRLLATASMPEPMQDCGPMPPPPPPLPPPPPISKSPVSVHSLHADLEGALETYQNQCQHRRTRNDGAVLLVPYRMAEGAAGKGGRVAELRLLLKGGRRFREALCKVYMDEMQVEEIELIFDDAVWLKAMKRACDDNTQKNKRLQQEEYYEESAGQMLQYLEEPFWPQLESAPNGLRRRTLLEALLLALSQEIAYAVIRQDFLARTPQQLIQQGKVRFEEEDGDDHGALHAEMITLFCTVFAKRFITDGLLDAKKIAKTRQLEEQLPKLPKVRESSATAEDDCLALGRITLHCRVLKIPTALGMLPLLYGAATGFLDASDWGNGRTLEEVKNQLARMGPIGNKIDLYLDALRPFLPENDAFIPNILQAASFDEIVFIGSDGVPLTSDGANIAVTNDNVQCYQWLFLRRKIFGTAVCPSRKLVKALGDGLRTFGNGVFDVLKQMDPEEIASELEGCLEITPRELLANVRFENDPTGQQREWFCRAVEARDATADKPVLHRPTLLGWLTGFRTLNRDFSLRPLKGQSSTERPQIVFHVDSGRDRLKGHVCTYAVDSPVFESYEAMLQGILEVYNTRNYDRP